ncbi:LOW QUALITY PROTEIN: CCAAT/enhancer-binding protein zeta [Nilaparvata lugens]|uniref:LOW QUALITY PROTEIN: CCAAT/enhancer-binding protein zeta n=1 Tax=Nilaparvata lugens TaxID=108931 RepID=UPI00193D2507|nr:LOW QUALITY PROTEIN: CCAAT/enhancer-binding protein zeta [Nilaparvata lugens]
MDSRRVNTKIKFSDNDTNGGGTVVSPEEDVYNDEYGTEVERKKWFEENNSTLTSISPLSEEEISTLKFEAERVLKDETSFHNEKEQRGKKGNDGAWLKTVFQKGTASDKIAAHVVNIQNNPLFSISSLTTLINMVKVGKKEFSLVIDNLCELFVEDLLPPNRRLLPFHKQPLDRLPELCSGNATSRRRYLVLWAYEDQLKNNYSIFVQALNVIAKDDIEANKEKSVSALYHLLAARPELEDVLLKSVVNKLGDPQRKIASKAIYCLTQLLKQHEAMKQIVLNEIEHLIFRSNVSQKAQYYAICFLSQFRYSAHDGELACNVISVYFAFFRACVKKGDVDSRMLGSLLMGVNRAYPYSKEKLSKISSHIDTLYKMVHMANYNISMQCLNILFHVSDSFQDRYYTALYKKLIEFDFAHSAHQAMILNLIYKSLSKDTNMGRVRTFIKRLLQLCGLMPVPLACGLLYAISQLIKNRPELLANRLEAQRAALDDDADDEECYKDVDSEANGDCKDESLLDDSVMKEEEAEVKNKETEVKQEESSEEKKERKPCMGWFHAALTTRRNTVTFDPSIRNPAFAKGESAVYTELTLLLNHFHPTVALFAKNILDNETIKYTGDPLVDFSLVRFMDRFVFKNPKQPNIILEEKGPDRALAQRKYYTPSGAKALPTNSRLYLEQNEEHVPIDELFLYKYLHHKKSMGYKVVPKEEDDSDLESVASEEFEEMLNNMPGFRNKDVDFAEDIGDNLSNTKTSKKGKNKDMDSDGSDDSDGGDDVGEEDDEDVSLDDASGDDDIDLDELDDDDEAISFDESDGDDEDMEVSNKKKPKKKLDENKLRKGISKLFAPAEQFSEMLENEGSSGFRTGTAHAVANKDKAAIKQLEWEMNRGDKSWSNKNKRKTSNKFSSMKKKKKMR